MKSVMKNQAVLKSFLALLLVLSGHLNVQAQEPGDGDDVPIDGGLSLLLAAGAAYGGKKVYDMRKKQQEGDNNKDSEG